MLFGIALILFVVVYAQPAAGGFALFNSTNSNTVTLYSGITTTSYNIKFPLAQGAAASLLSNDGAGNLSWATAAPAGWTLLGNTGTTPGTNFLGTTDVNALIFKTNNIFSGQIGVSNTAPTAYGFQSGSTGNYNAFFGAWSGSAATSSATNNTALGAYAMYQISSSVYNSAIGYNSLGSLTSGTGNNSVIGYGTGLGITTGSGNTIIGANVTGLATALTNNIIIADGTGNQRIKMASTGQLTIPSVITAGAATDKAVTADASGNVRTMAAPLFNEVIRGKAICPASTSTISNHSTTSYDTPDFIVISATTYTGGTINGSITSNTNQVVIFQYTGTALTNTSDAYGFTTTYRSDQYTDTFASTITKIVNVSGYTQITISFCRVDATGATNWGSGPQLSLLVIR